MSSDSAEGVGAQPPSPEGLQELIDALKAACSEVATARDQLVSDAKTQAEQLRAEASRSIATAQAAAEGLQRDLRGAQGLTARRLTDFEQRAGDLTARLAGELSESQKARSRVEAGVEELSSALRQVRADRQTWEAQGRAAAAREGAALLELHQALLHEKARVTALEAANMRLLEAHATLEERLGMLERKKVFGLF